MFTPNQPEKRFEDPDDLISKVDFKRQSSTLITVKTRPQTGKKSIIF